MCGIVGFLDKSGREDRATGRVILEMLQALGCRGPDSAGIALLRAADGHENWRFRVGPRCLAEGLDARLARRDDLGTLLDCQEEGDTYRFTLRPRPGLTVEMLEEALDARPGGLEVLCLGERLDLVKQVGSPDALEAAYGISAWRGPLAIGHTRMSTESKIDLSHSQPFWAHGLPDLATVHNGHVTNYHQLRRRYEQQGIRFYTENDSEVIGVYLREQIEAGRSLSEALAASVRDLDGAFSYLVTSPEGLGLVRDRFGFKPLVVAETDDFVAVATEEMALRRALHGTYSVSEPDPGSACLFALPSSPLRLSVSS